MNGEKKSKAELIITILFRYYKDMKIVAMLQYCIHNLEAFKILQFSPLY